MMDSVVLVVESALEEVAVALEEVAVAMEEVAVTLASFERVAWFQWVVVLFALTPAFVDQVVDRKLRSLTFYG